MLVAIPLGGYVLWSRTMEGFFEAVFAGETGTVTKREEWPRPLRRLVGSAEEPNIELRELQV